MISISFQIDNKLHTSPKSWQDVKFGYYLDYFEKVGRKEPKELIDFIQGYHKALSELDEGLSDRDREAQGLRLFSSEWAAMSWQDRWSCYCFFALDVGYWCKADPKIIIKGLSTDDLTATYWGLQVQMNPDNATIDKDYTGFELKGVEYLLPKTHMIGSTVGEFADAAYFQEQMSNVKGGNWGAMLDVMTVICRPKNETYNDNEAFRNKRKALFKQLPMSDVINVAFFLLRLNETLNSNLMIYMAAEELQQQQRKSSANATGGHQLFTK